MSITEVATAGKKAVVRDIGTINSGAGLEILAEGGMVFVEDVEVRCGSLGPAICVM
jgi:hypothetical protein